MNDKQRRAMFAKFGRDSEFTGKHFLFPDGQISKRVSFHQNQLDDLGFGYVRPFLKNTGIVRIKATPDEFLDVEAHNPLTEPQLRVIVGFVRKNRLNPSSSFNVDDFTMDNSVGKQLGERILGFQASVLPDDLKKKSYEQTVRKI